MKLLLSVLFLIVTYELLYEKIYKENRNKYFCKKVSEDIKLIHPQDERIFYNNFNVVVQTETIFNLFLEDTIVASWEYIDNKITSVCVRDMELFNLFKETYHRI
jgi:hypothetical protein